MLQVLFNKLIKKQKLKLQEIRTRPSKSEVMRLVCDSQLFKNHTNWKPKYSFDSGLKETIDWFKIMLARVQIFIIYKK